MQNKREEELIHTWLELNLTIKESKYLDKMSFNQVAVCHYIYRSEQNSDGFVTATELSYNMRMLKSQLNSLINQMIYKGYVYKEQSQEDKRVYKIGFTDNGRQAYLSEHENILLIAKHINSLIDKKELDLFLDRLALITKEFRKIK